MSWIQSRRVRVGVGVAIGVALLGLAALATPAHSQDWPNRFVVGATITQPQEEAPIFINTVWAESPAGRAGITSVSRLLAIDGVQVIDLREAAKRMSSDKAGSVTLPQKPAAIQHPVVAPQHPVAINELGDLATKGTA
jgi:predicted metalloprotease with PDZ domain